MWEMKRNMSVVCVCSAPNCCSILISGKIIKEMSGSVASGTPCMCFEKHFALYIRHKFTLVQSADYFNITPAGTYSNH